MAIDSSGQTLAQSLTEEQKLLLDGVSDNQLAELLVERWQRNAQESFPNSPPVAKLKGGAKLLNFISQSYVRAVVNAAIGSCFGFEGIPEEFLAPTKVQFAFDVVPAPPLEYAEDVVDTNDPFSQIYDEELEPPLITVHTSVPQEQVAWSPLDKLEALYCSLSPESQSIALLLQSAMQYEIAEVRSGKKRTALPEDDVDAFMADVQTPIGVLAKRRLCRWCGGPHDRKGAFGSGDCATNYSQFIRQFTRSDYKRRKEDPVKPIAKQVFSTLLAREQLGSFHETPNR